MPVRRTRGIGRSVEAGSTLSQSDRLPLVEVTAVGRLVSRMVVRVQKRGKGRR